MIPLPLSRKYAIIRNRNRPATEQTRRPYRHPRAHGPTFLKFRSKGAEFVLVPLASHPSFPDRLRPSLNRTANGSEELRECRCSLKNIPRLDHPVAIERIGLIVRASPLACCTLFNASARRCSLQYRNCKFPRTAGTALSFLQKEADVLRHGKTEWLVELRLSHDKPSWLGKQNGINT